jgi:GT2 family glycosyltransferase
VIVVDNSGIGLVRQLGAVTSGIRIIENTENAGFGRAINQAYRSSRAPFIATLNDDAVPCPDWLEALLNAARQHAGVGMCASQVRLRSAGLLDSAGMLVARDGSSKQRGHGLPPEMFRRSEEVLLPSGSAALYRREVLDQTGGFDEHFFLYCEDTDLGLRAQWAGWRCLYVPDAVVEHAYSQSAGRSSPLKAYYVERNRLFVAMKTFPARMLWLVPLASLARYFWHLAAMWRGQGRTAEFVLNTNPLLLPWYVAKAHLATVIRLPRLLAQRAEIRRTARINSREFLHLLRMNRIGVKQVAEL